MGTKWTNKNVLRPSGKAHGSDNHVHWDSYGDNGKKTGAFHTSDDGKIGDKASKINDAAKKTSRS